MLLKQSFHFGWWPLVLLCLLVGCRNSDATQKNTSDPSATFQALMEKVVANNDAVPGLQLHIEAPRLGISWSGAAGVADVASQKQLEKEQPFRVASVTKTFVAASILKLMEEGKLSLNDPISRYISQEHRQILQDGQYDPDQIAIRHLLTHTSGLFDYALGNSTFAKKVSENPQYRWTRTDQLQGAMDWGQAYGSPGEKYHYSDTGYILLGEALESITGKPLAQALRDLIGYEQLALQSTWLETLEEQPKGILDRTHQYLEKTDTYDWDPSFDLYGGGGLVSTTSDLARFFQSLFNKKVFSQATTTDSLLYKMDLPEAGKGEGGRQADYRCGIEVAQAFNTDLYMHTGFWGIQVAYLPEYDATIALNFVQGSNYFFLKKLVSVIGEMDFEREE